MAQPTEDHHDFLDAHGRDVHAFASRMSNLGFAQLSDEILSMFKSGSWRDFGDGLGRYDFLPGEFDYFLTQQGVSRDDVISGVRDIDTKALFESAMDERKTGQADYRRSVMDARAANPERPGRPIKPFGYTVSEARYLLRAGHDDVVRGVHNREPMGAAVRRYTNSHGETSRRPSETAPPATRVRRAALRLGDADLVDLAQTINDEIQRRRRHARENPTLDLGDVENSASK